MREFLIAHPETGEILNKRQWAERIGITSSALTGRMKNHPLAIALQPGKLPLSKDIWSKEENDYLEVVYRAPNLQKLWNRKASSVGWKLRTHYALNAQIYILQHRGVLNGRRHIEEAEGWLTMNQLAECMGISADTVRYWISQGVKCDRNGSHFKIHLKGFTEWACTPNGAGLVAKAIRGDAIASTWLLVQIGNWAKK